MGSFPFFRIPRCRTNPVLKRELLDLLRKRSAFVYLGCFLIISLLMLLYSWNGMIHNIQETESLSSTVAPGFLLLQILFIFFLIPSISSSMITLEMENDTWNLLRTTPISQTRILMGKWLSSVLFIWLLLIALLPFFGILILTGSYSPREMFLYVVLISETAFLTSLFGLVCSAWCRHTIQSVIFTYILIVMYYAVLPVWAHYNGFRSISLRLIDEIVTAASPLNLYLLLQQNPQKIQTALFPPWLLHGLGVVCICVVLWCLCLLGIRRRSGIPEWSGRLRRLAPSPRLGARPLRLGDDENPILAKELHQLMGRNAINLWTYNFILLFLGLFLLYLHTLDPIRGFRWSPVFYLAALLLTPFLSIPPAVNAFCLEKDRKTWDLLQSTSLTPKDILRGKFWACMIHFTIRFLSFYGVILLVGFFIEPFMGWYGPQKEAMLLRHRLIVVVSVWLSFIWAIVYTGVCLCFSLTSRNTQSANIKAILLSFCFLFLFPALLILITFPAQEGIAVVGYFSPLFLLVPDNFNTSLILYYVFVQTFLSVICTGLALSFLEDRLTYPQY